MMADSAAISKLVGVLIAIHAISAAAVETNAWEAIERARGPIQPLVDAGRYREAASAWNAVLSRARDKGVKSYARYAYAQCQLRRELAQGRPGNVIISQAFDDQQIPASYCDGRELLAVESIQTFAESPGALRIIGPNPEKFLLAESYATFALEPDTILSVCLFPHHVGEAKFQLNTSRGSVHYFWKEQLKADAWNVLTFRLDLDGSAPLYLGDTIKGVAFVGQAEHPDAFVVLDELHVIAHP